MIKVTTLIKRRPELTHEEFIARWRDQHAPLVRDLLPRLRKYVLHFPVGESEWDGIVELHFDTLADQEAAYASDDWNQQARIDSTERIIDTSHVIAIVAEEYVVPLADTLTGDVPARSL